MRKVFGLLVLAALVTTPPGARADGALDQVRGRGELLCGVTQGTIGFSAMDAKGEMSGLDVDICKAVAAAVLKDASKVRYIPLSSTERFIALQSGRVDLLARTTTWTLGREMEVGVDFVAINFYDGQGFMVRKSANIASAKQLDGATICMRQGTTSPRNVADWFHVNKLTYKPLLFEQADEVVKAYDEGRCDSYSIDAGGGLAADRLKTKVPSDHVILPEIISKEPLGLAVRRNDSNWASVVRWSYWALVIGEELGVTQANADDMKNSDNPEIRRLLGVDSSFGEKLGIDKEFGYRAIKAVGNYGESYDRNVGAGSPVKLGRGINALWNKGGLLYAPPWH
jgi:general L-amino acid transport system substrate-binding protein